MSAAGINNLLAGRSELIKEHAAQELKHSRNFWWNYIGMDET